MKKKIVIGIVVALVVLVILTGIIMYTDFGNSIVGWVYEELVLPKETVEMEPITSAKVTYMYRMQTDEKFTLEISDEELLNLIYDNIHNKKLKNYSSSVGLAMMGEYNVDLGNGVSFLFDSYDEDGYVRLNNNGDKFLTRLNPEILQGIIDVVDVELTARASIFQTDKVTISQGETVTEITEKTALAYIEEKCKDIFTKEIENNPEIKTPDYVMDFHNNIKLYIYHNQESGWMEKDGKILEVHQLTVFDSLLEKALTENKQKRERFTTSTITITDPDKTIEITDKETIEKITTPLIYSSVQELEWLKDYDITEEYNGGIKVKINDYEYLIPGKVGTVNIGNRYVISKDGTLSLCSTLLPIDDYINDLLGNKKEKVNGSTIMVVQ